MRNVLAKLLSERSFFRFCHSVCLFCYIMFESVYFPAFGPQQPYFESEGGRFLYIFYRHLPIRLDLKHFCIEFLTPNFVSGDEKRRIIFPAKFNPHVASEIVVICLHHGVTDVVSMNLSPLSLLYIITARC